MNMEIQKQINDYIASQPDAIRSDIETLHKRILITFPDCKLWFLDGKNNNGKIVSNPNIGYGLLLLNYANGKTREFYQIGISANKTGLSVYFMGLKDRKYLLNTFGKTIGKATVTGYCIKFRSLKDINIGILESAIRDVVKQTY